MKVEDFMQALEPGLYKFDLVKSNTDNTTLKGDTMIALEWSEEETGILIWDNVTVSKAAAWRMGQLWLALGGNDQDEVGDDIDDFGERLLQQVEKVRTVYAVVYKDTYKSKERGEVTRSKISEYKTEEIGKVLIGKQEVSGVTF